MANTEDNVDIGRQIAEIEGEITQDQKNEPEYERLYRMYENSRIPVSKSLGKMWHMRYKEVCSLENQTGMTDRWDEVIAYYQNDQGAMHGKKNMLSELSRGKAHDRKFLSENVVFANTSALVPATYAKNPDVSITSEIAENEEQAQLYERLVDALMKRKQAPGINIKPKMKKAVVTANLTNIAYLVLSYTFKEDSSEAAVQEIARLAEELEQAKDVRAIAEIEGKLQALEEKVSVLASAGPCIKYKLPHMVKVAPSCDTGDITDADWVIVGDYIRTDYLRAVYGKRNEQGEYESIFKPTHIIKGDVNAQGHDDEIEHFTLLSDGKEHQEYGFKTYDEFRHACHTLCWTVWDKTTRRVYLFSDCDWSWPLWVWDDPYSLSRFYPVFALTFVTDPKDMFARSEVMYYLDHQDELNDINNERSRMRHWAATKVFVNSNVVKDASKLEKFLRGDTDNAVYSLDFPEDRKITDAIGAFPLPSTQLEQLFDARPILEGINRLSSVTPVMQNAQFKTNTTNKAIESYESSTQMRLDEKIDAIEECLADIGRALIEMCIQFMPASDVAALLGQRYVESKGGWVEGRNVQEFTTDFNFTIVGGSTLKPTSKVKKEQAAQLGQVLGQFANASPMVVLVMLKMLQRAFGDDVVITPEEWDMIVQSTQQQMQRGMSTGEGGPPQQGGGSAPQQPSEEGAQPGADQIAQVIDSLPPPLREQLAQGIAQGVPLQRLMQSMVQQAAQQQPQQ